MSVSYDTLNTIFKLQGKPTTIPNLKYYEKAYNKFSYIYKKEIKDNTGKLTGYLFVQAEPRSYKSEGLLPSLHNSEKNIFRNIRLYIPMRFTMIMNWSLIIIIIHFLQN